MILTDLRDVSLRSHRKGVRGNKTFKNQVQIYKHRCVNEVLSKPQRDPKVVFH